ncbi:MAG TPA: protein-tyrosine-phosphatase [Planctomycetaceae bacterium]|nr:protein-tyrosine-phosphatase [Planctomycetaceae bacterium]
MATNSEFAWLPGLAAKTAIYKIAAAEIPAERQQMLSAAASEIAAGLQEHGEIALNFICTHNSRRSHLAQLWAAIACTAFGVEGVSCVSGGTEATACNERIVRSLRRAGLSVVAQSPASQNPVYLVQYEERTQPIELYSKKYDDPSNPSQNFFAMMCCSDADEKCPVVLGAIGRVSLHFVDPKISDGTDQESATYDHRRDQIASEMCYLVAQIAQQSAA